MIKDPPLLNIAREIKRPAKDILEGFRDAPPSFVTDAMGGRGAMDYRIKPIGKASSFLGVALTCWCGPGDNLALAAAVAQCQPGDVLVAATDGFTATGVIGDLLMGIAKNRGAAAVVTDGMVRDADDIETLNFPCFATGLTPNSVVRNGPGTVGLPVQCGGVTVASGDIVLGGRDGVVVVPRTNAAHVLKELAAVREAEAALLAMVRGGLTEVGFVTELLASDRVRRVDG
jgi:4-hydroxy-4-methyl-2-oxoglutarate aldolase